MSASEQKKETIFVIQKMDCPTEEKLIRNRLQNMAGVDDLRFNLMERELTVRYSLESDETIEAALQDLDMAPARKDSGDQKSDAHAAIPNATKIVVGLSGVAALTAEISGWVTGNEQSPAVIALAVIAILTGGYGTAKKGWTALRTFTLNIYFLMTIAVIGAVLIGEWPEAAMVTFLFAFAELIESYSLDRARNAIRSLMQMTPDTATVKQPDGSWQSISVDDVKVEALVRVKPGERIPLDGIITSGQSSINQAPITGESMPVEKKVGDTVFAGSINERGSFEFRVTSNKGNTTLARIIRSVQAAQGDRAPTQRFVDRFAAYYTPAVVVLAILIAAVPPLFFGAVFKVWFYKALVMLVIACPCALVISTPVTVVSGLAVAARNGILIKGGVYLEEGRKLKALALDKTGTLTHGKPVVTDISPLDGEAADKYLRIAGSLESHSEHPVARAVTAHVVKEKGQNTLQEVTDFESITGRGIKGKIDGTLYYIGNHRLVEELGICNPNVEAVLEKLEKEGKTTVILATEQKPLCILAVADTIRDTSVAAIQDLEEQGIRCVILTGDNQVTANAIAASTGIKDVRGNMLPEDKLKAIEELQQRYGVIGMVGDGINDAPALAKASIGFAMGAAGTDTALETADVALMQDDLHRLPLFIALSQKTGAILKQHITLAITIKAVFLVMNFANVATLWMAVFADMGASLIVVFNGLRLLKFKKAACSHDHDGHNHGHDHRH
ncbi:MAG: cadmium-translocating P-type ATPase [Alphaproteobacteria bacterium]|nr:MAG: cadmium-translocating P-type ATPase [Alphaproteobacteria bacterium]